MGPSRTSADASRATSLGHMTLTGPLQTCSVWFLLVHSWLFQWLVLLNREDSGLITTPGQTEQSVKSTKVVFTLHMMDSQIQTQWRDSPSPEPRPRLGVLEVQSEVNPNPFTNWRLGAEDTWLRWPLLLYLKPFKRTSVSTICFRYWELSRLCVSVAVYIYYSSYY